MDDLINRKGIVDTVCEGISCNECSFNEIDGESGCLLEYRIDNLPSAQKTGRWIRRTIPSTLGYYEYECGECGHIWQYGELLGWNYCPSCGCRMEREEK